MNDIKLLALDLDGTLLNSRGEVSDENLSAIRAAEDAGVLVTIATGRRFRDARPVAIDIGLNAPILTHNGALIKVAESLETVSADLLEAGTVLDILKIGSKFGGDALVSADPHGKGTLLYETVSDDNIPLLRYIEWSKRLHGKEASDAVHHVESIEDLLGEVEVIHISFSGACVPMERLKTELRTELLHLANVVSTVYPHLDFTLLDILPMGSSKATGLAKLSELHGLTPDDIMAIGDNFNDVEMLEYAGTAVVMGNADPSLLRRKEFYTTEGYNESGVAAAIYKHILGVFNG